MEKSDANKRKPQGIIHIRKYLQGFFFRNQFVARYFRKFTLENIKRQTSYAKRNNIQAKETKLFESKKNFVLL
jgi:hypothetical protein